MRSLCSAASRVRKNLGFEKGICVFHPSSHLSSHPVLIAAVFYFEVAGSNSCRNATQKTSLVRKKVIHEAGEAHTRRSLAKTRLTPRLP